MNQQPQIQTQTKENEVLDAQTKKFLAFLTDEELRVTTARLTNLKRSFALFNLMSTNRLRKIKCLLRYQRFL